MIKEESKEIITTELVIDENDPNFKLKVICKDNIIHELSLYGNDPRNPLIFTISKSNVRDIDIFIKLLNYYINAKRNNDKKITRF